MAKLPVSRTHGIASLVSLVKNMPRDPATQEPRFALLLGAGASVSSGIPHARTLTRAWKQTVFLGLIEEEVMTPGLRRQFEKAWDTEGPPGPVKINVHKDKTVTIPNFLKWKEKVNTFERHPSDYSLLFSRTFQDVDSRQGFIERLCAAAEPGAGYVYLSCLVRDNIFRTILTTNFDDLVHDAIFRYSGMKPIVCAFDSQVETIRLTSPRPKIIKLHGDFLYTSIKNVGSEVSRLDVNMRRKFEEASSNFGLIVVGYSGGDQSIMDPIRSMLTQPGYFGHGLHWCVHSATADADAPGANAPWEDREIEVPEEVRRLQDAYPERVHVYSVGSFDEVMGALFRGCGSKPPDDLVHPESRSFYVRLREAITNAEQNWQLELPFRDLLTRFREAQENIPHPAAGDMDAADGLHGAANRAKTLLDSTRRHHGDASTATSRAELGAKCREVAALYQLALDWSDVIAGTPPGDEKVAIAADNLVAYEARVKADPRVAPDTRLSRLLGDRGQRRDHPPAADEVAWDPRVSLWLHRRRAGALTGGAEFLFRAWEEETDWAERGAKPVPTVNQDLAGDPRKAAEQARKDVLEANKKLRRSPQPDWFRGADGQRFVHQAWRAWLDCEQGWKVAEASGHPAEVVGHIRNLAYNGLLAGAYLLYAERSAAPLFGQVSGYATRNAELRALCVEWVRYLMADQAFGDEYLREFEDDLGGHDFLTALALWDAGEELPDPPPTQEEAAVEPQPRAHRRKPQ